MNIGESQYESGSIKSFSARDDDYKLEVFIQTRRALVAHNSYGTKFRVQTWRTDLRSYEDKLTNTFSTFDRKDAFAEYNATVLAIKAEIGV